MCILHFIPSQLNTQFSPEILDLYLDFIKFREKVESHIQVFPNILKVFP